MEQDIRMRRMKFFTQFIFEAKLTGFYNQKVSRGARNAGGGAAAVSLRRCINRCARREKLLSLRPVKLIGYILSFYIILLATIPCCAFDNCPDEKKEMSSNHQSGDEDCGNCSPFFNCEGCSTATISMESPSYSLPALQVLSGYTSYVRRDLPDTDFDVWQPPKIAC